MLSAMFTSVLGPISQSVCEQVIHILNDSCCFFLKNNYAIKLQFCICCDMIKLVTSLDIELKQRAFLQYFSSEILKPAWSGSVVFTEGPCPHAIVSSLISRLFHSLLGTALMADKMTTLHWKQKIINLITKSSLMVSLVVVTTIYGVTTDEKVLKLTIFSVGQQ